MAPVHAAAAVPFPGTGGHSRPAPGAGNTNVATRPVMNHNWILSSENATKTRTDKNVLKQESAFYLFIFEVSYVNLQMLF